MFRLLPLLLLLPLAACSDGSDTDDTDLGTDTDSDTVDENTVAALLARDDRFSTLAHASGLAGYDVILASPGTFTVFAPTDDAFDDFLQALALTDIDALGPTGISTLLSYHALGAVRTSDDLPARAESLAGYTLFFPEGDAPNVNAIPFAQSDIQASNGVIHVIDQVLVPTTLRHAAELSGHTAFADAIGEASSDTQRLIDDLDGNTDPITVFAPSNEALASVDTTGWSEADYDVLLAYHVARGDLRASALPATASTFATNAYGQDLSIVFPEDDDRVVNDADIDVVDIVALGGRLHLVDGVLTQPTVVDLAAYAGLTSLSSSLDAAGGGLATTLSLDAQAYTVFAPTNLAFLAVQDTLDGLSATELDAALATHAIAGSAPLTSSDLATRSYTTLSGEAVSVTVDGGVSVEDADVVQADLIGTNGVVHIVDAVIGVEPQ